MSSAAFTTEATRALRNTTTGELETFATHKLSGWFAYEMRLTQGWQDDFEMSERQELLTILEPNKPEDSKPNQDKE